MKRLAAAVLFICMAAIGASYAATLVLGAAPAWGAWVMAFATTIAMVATMALGAAKRGKPYGGLGPLALPFAVTLVLLLAAFAAALLLPGGAEVIVLGLPRRAAVIIYGVGVLPVLILPLAYALTFEKLTLDERDLERVREAARASGKLRADEPATSGPDTVEASLR